MIMKRLILISLVVFVNQFVFSQSIINLEYSTTTSPNYVSGLDTLKTHFVTVEIDQLTNIECIKIVLVDLSVVQNNVEIVTTVVDISQYELEVGYYELVLGDYINFLFDEVKIVLIGPNGVLDSETIIIQ